MIRRWLFRRAVRRWRRKLKRHAFLVREIQQLQAQLLAVAPRREAWRSKLALQLHQIGLQRLDRLMQEYRPLDDELRARFLAHLRRRFVNRGWVAP